MNKLEGRSSSYAEKTVLFSRKFKNPRDRPFFHRAPSLLRITASRKSLVTITDTPRDRNRTRNLALLVPSSIAPTSGPYLLIDSFLFICANVVAPTRPRPSCDSNTCSSGTRGVILDVAGSFRGSTTEYAKYANGKPLSPFEIQWCIGDVIGGESCQTGLDRYSTERFNWSSDAARSNDSRELNKKKRWTRLLGRNSFRRGQETLTFTFTCFCYVYIFLSFR